MKKNAKLVFNILKPKVKALGFSREELEGIAADIADNLELDEEASDEDVNAEIEKKIDAVIPYLKIAQKTAQRTIQRFKDSEGDDDPTKRQGGVGNAKPQKQEDSDNEVPAWAKSIIEQQKSVIAELAGIRERTTTDVRREKLKTILKDAGAFGKSTLKNFDMMKFEDENKFEEFLDGVEEDLAAINQERANLGLGKLGAPAAQQERKKNEVEVISDEDIESLAETM